MSKPAGPNHAAPDVPEMVKSIAEVVPNTPLSEVVLTEQTTQRVSRSEGPSIPARLELFRTTDGCTRTPPGTISIDEAGYRLIAREPDRS